MKSKNPLDVIVIFQTTIRSTNQTGVPGGFKGRRLNGNTYFVAYLSMPDGKRLSKSFTVKSRESEDAVFAMAVASRQLMLDEADSARPMFKTAAAAIATERAKSKM